MRSKKAKALFVVGTDTGVGKTIVSGLLGRYLNEKKILTTTQKWVQSGGGNFSQDIAKHLQLMRKPRASIKPYLKEISSYVFNFPASPHLAAKREGRTISQSRIKKDFMSLSKEFNFTIVEASGGALVPFSKRKLLIDIAKDLNLPVLIVAANKLGAINHTLLTIEALRLRRMKILGVVFNNLSKKTDLEIVNDNPKIIKAISKVSILGTLPWQRDKQKLYRAFKPMAKKILAKVKL
tara:strand:- start:906 stop:1616 length:711 start_codon:yes stop_codon:yes gene_type:complete